MKQKIDVKLDRLHKEADKMRIVAQKESRNILYWQTILIMFIANLFLAIVLIPILLMLSGWFSVVVVGILGLLFGLIFNHLIRDIAYLEKHHQVFAGSFIPAMSVIDLFLITKITNKVAPMIGIDGRSDTFILSLVFLVGFLLPYVLTFLRKK